jgi:hypothetical protein
LKRKASNYPTTELQMSPYCKSLGNKFTTGRSESQAEQGQGHAERNYGIDIRKFSSKDLLPRMLRLLANRMFPDW